jgi:hypothetical protein
MQGNLIYVNSSKSGTDLDGRTRQAVFFIIALNSHRPIIWQAHLSFTSGQKGHDLRLYLSDTVSTKIFYFRCSAQATGSSEHQNHLQKNDSFDPTRFCLLLQII